MAKLPLGNAWVTVLARETAWSGARLADSRPNQRCSGWWRPRPGGIGAQ